MGWMEEPCLVSLVQHQVLAYTSCEGIKIYPVPLVVVLEFSEQAVATTMQGCTDGPTVMCVV